MHDVAEISFGDVLSGTYEMCIHMGNTSECFSYTRRTLPCRTSEDLEQNSVQTAEFRNEDHHFPVQSEA